MTANAGGTGGSWTWSSELVRDNRDYNIGHDIIVNLPNERSSISVRASGYEHDDTSANDELPAAEYTHTSIDDWSIGATGSLFGSNDDFEYELRYTMTCAAATSSSALSAAFYQQPDWRWCSKCQGLWFAGRQTVGVCPSGNGHSRQGSGNYALFNNEPNAPGQHNWRWCNKCMGLYFRGNSIGRCPAGGGHNYAGSGDYAVVNQLPSAPGQHGWRWCRKCQGIWFSGRGTTGRCPAGGGHDPAAGGDYALEEV